jgi:phospholipid transport system substrate-binding protein
MLVEAIGCAAGRNYPEYAGIRDPDLELIMRRNRFSLTVVFAIAMTAVVAAGAAAPKPKPPLAKTPAHMAGLDPKVLGKPADIVRRRWGAVIRVLQDKKLDQPTKISRVEEIVTPAFDFRTMTLLALGKTNWRKFTTAQQTEFSALFVKRMKESYSKRIADYGGEKVFFKPPLPQKTSKSSKPATRPADGPKIVHVPVEIASKTRRWVVLHKFRKVGAAYRIYDIEIEGVSILRSYRSQFNDVLRRGKPEDLLARLRKPPPPAPKGGKRP